MKSEKVARVVLLCVAVCLLLCLLADVAEAKEGVATGKGDKNLSQKEGLDVLSGSKDTDESKTPTKLQKTMGLASVFVAFAVVKWL